MVRIPPERSSGARLELRVGHASANPYLLIAGIRIMFEELIPRLAAIRLAGDIPT
jgi:hypothetical protein